MRSRITGLWRILYLIAARISGLGDLRPGQHPAMETGRSQALAAGRFDPAAAGRYLTAHADRFDLFHPPGRGCRTPGWPASAPRTPASTSWSWAGRPATTWSG